MRGDTSGKEMPHFAQASRSEKRMLGPSTTSTWAPPAPVAPALEIVEELAVLALAPPDHRGQHEQAAPAREREHPIHHLLHGLGGDDLAALRTVRNPHAREQHPQIVANLGDGAHCPPR